MKKLFVNLFTRQLLLMYFDLVCRGSTPDETKYYLFSQDKITIKRITSLIKH